MGKFDTASGRAGPSFLKCIFEGTMSRIWKTIAIIMLTSLMLTPVFASDNSLAKAIYNDEIDFAMGLIAEGADLDADYLGYSPIKAAVNAGEVDLAIALIDAGANVTGNNLG